MKDTEEDLPFGQIQKRGAHSPSDPNGMLILQLEQKMAELASSTAALHAGENRFHSAFESSAIGLVIARRRRKRSSTRIPSRSC